MIWMSERDNESSLYVQPYYRTASIIKLLKENGMYAEVLS